MPTTTNGPVQVTPGAADINDPSQMNVTDYSGQLVGNPSAFFTHDNPQTDGTNESMLMTHQNQDSIMNAENGGLIDPITGLPVDAMNAPTAQGTAYDAQAVDGRTAQVYDPALVSQQIANDGQMTAAQGSLSQGSQINVDDIVIDTDAVASGSTGTGQALKDYAKQGMEVVDTSTPEGQIRAAQLGEGNFTEYKATMQGQLAELQDDFVDPETGEAKIPMWAAATARNVSKIATFTGMTGSAATQAMATALMEASIPIAQNDAQFFQTITLQNLNNRQEATLNRANVLAKMDLANMDNRMAAAVTTSQNFLKMDMANLSNRQQESIINTQARIQGILEDANSTNTARLFEAESQNDMDRFYDNLNSAIDQFNVNQKNQMEAFNATESNTQERFNSQMEDSREKFYKSMQYNIDVANAQWRQTVTLTEDQQAFEAAATDVKNMVGISVEQLNQIWDRSDSLLDYLWKSTDNEQQRQHELILQQLAAKSTKSLAKLQGEIADNAGKGAIFGTILGGLSAGIGASIGDFL